MKYYIDFEANSPSNEIIQIGCVSENNLTFTTFIQPDTPLNSYVKNLTGITQDNLNNAPSLDQAIQNFAQWLYSTQKNFAWNNTQFFCYGNADRNFITASLPHSHDNQTFLFLATLGTILQDFSQQTKHYFTEEVSLIRAINYFSSTPYIQDHDALNDAVLLKKLVEQLPINKRLNVSPFSIKNTPITQPITRMKHNQIIEIYPQLLDATNWCIHQNSIAAQQLIKPKRVSNKILKAIYDKSAYCGYRWRFLEEIK